MRNSLSEVKIRVGADEQDHIQGSLNSPLVMIEYADYECVFCKQAYLVVKELQNVFKKDLCYIFRNFPLSQIHVNAVNAARTAEAAGLQDKFWGMHDRLFENQDELDEDSLLSYAASMNLNMDKFVSDVGSEEIEERIVTDFYGGAQSGVSSTPTFFINGFRFQGDWSYNNLLYILTEIRDSTSSPSPHFV
jgi:protein-disulfide isomerase